MALGFEWDILANDWENSFAALTAHKAKYGDCRVPAAWPENPSLGIWVSNQRGAQRAGKLSPERTARLEALGFEWGTLANDWENSFAALTAYKAKYGDCRVPTQGGHENAYLGRWVSTQRRVRKAGKLSAERVARLEALGFKWSLSRD